MINRDRLVVRMAALLHGRIFGRFTVPEIDGFVAPAPDEAK